MAWLTFIKQVNMEQYKFGNLTIKIDCPVLLGKSHWLEPFRVEQEVEEPIVTLKCMIEDFKLSPNARYLRRGMDTDYYEINGVEYAVYWRKPNPQPLITMAMLPENEKIVYISSSAEAEYYNAHVLLRHIELIHLLQQYGIWVLHSCYVKTPQGAILFSANSGVGKSTQGQLWEKYGGGEVINGDRCVLYRDENGFHTGGFVYSGSSGICKNETMPLRAIVFLRQSKENKVSRMRPAEVIKNLYMQLVSCPYREEESMRKLDFASRLCEEAEIVRLDCRPDADAVKVLQNYLFEREEECQENQ